jgi:hypothetical protein
MPRWAEGVIMHRLLFILRYLAAVFRLNRRAVCEMSSGLGLINFHDWPDGEFRQPWHMYVHRCARCGKEFTI